MTPVRHGIALALCAALAACGEHGGMGQEWAGARALAGQQQRAFTQAAYHADAQARAHDHLAQRHLVEQARNPARIAAERDAFLQDVGQGRWLTGEDLQVLSDPAWLERWDAALRGEDLSVAMETGALVRQRQQAWQAHHGPKAGAPQPRSMAATPAQWRAQMVNDPPVEGAAPLAPLAPDGVVQALVAARAHGLDPHTHHVGPAVARHYEEGALRVSTGTGVVYAWKAGRLEVVEVVPDSPAARADVLEEGDVLVAFRIGQDPWIVATDPTEAIALMDQAQGQLGVRVRRDRRDVDVVLDMPQASQDRAFANDQERVVFHREIWSSGAKSLDVLRAQAWFLYENGQDGQGIAGHVAQALALAKSLPGAEPDLVVVDLRHCRGGALPQAAHLAGLFVSGGDLLTLRGRGGVDTGLPDPDGPAVWEGPVQVWVGPQTASAAEAVAQALADRAGAVVVGWPTFGKGTLQRRVALDLHAARSGDPSRLGELWLTTQEMVGVEGHSLQHQGVALDFALPHPAPEPWGERALEGALAPTPGGDAGAPVALGTDVVGALDPSMDDAQGLAGWHAAGLEAHTRSQGAQGWARGSKR